MAAALGLAIGLLGLTPAMKQASKSIPMANKKKTKRERNFIMSSNWAPYVEQLLDSYIGIDFPTPESREQQKWMKSLILDKVRQTGMLSGDIDYSDYDSSNPNRYEPARNRLGIPVTKHGFDSPETAYQNTLGLGKFTIEPTGGRVVWSPESTEYNFDDYGHVGDVVNRGGLFGIVKEMITGTPTKPQHYIPDIKISREELSKAFSGGMLGGQQKFRRK